MNAATTDPSALTRTVTVDRARLVAYADASGDQTVAVLINRGDGPARVAAISGLLRRAARRHVPDAANREGDAWLALLDEGLEAPLFSQGPGRLLRDGAFRPGLDDADVEALRELARARFIGWMQRR